MLPSNIVRTRERAARLWIRADELLDTLMLDAMRGEHKEVDWKYIEEIQAAALIVNSLAMTLYQSWNARGCVEFMPQIVNRLANEALARPDWDSVEYTGT